MRAVERTLDILELLGQAGDGRRITEISRRLKVPVSTIHRYLSSLASRGYVEQNAASQKYHLGLQALRLKDSSVMQMHMPAQARVGMLKLLDETGQTVHLAILSGIEIVYLDTLDAPSSFIIRTPPGKRAPAYHTSLGRALLAALPDEEVERRFAGSSLEALTPFTITTLPALIADLYLVRERGYAVDRRESGLGHWCIAAPVRDYTGEVVAAISVAMLLSQIPMDEEPRLSKLLLKVCSSVSSQLGYVAHARDA